MHSVRYFNKQKSSCILSINCRANTCTKSRLPEGMYLLDNRYKANASFGSVQLASHDNCSNRMALRWQWFIQISALSTFDGRVLAYHGYNG